MDAVIVYQIVKALSFQEKNRLFDMLQKDLEKQHEVSSPSKKKPLLTDEEATMYLLKKCF